MALVVAAMAGIPQPRASAQAAIQVYVDGQAVNFDVPPTVIQGRVLVPLRGIFERLGATVDYDARTQHIVAVRGPQTVELTIGSRQARVNETAKLLDVSAFTIAGRTLVPLRVHQRITRRECAVGRGEPDHSDRVEWSESAASAIDIAGTGSIRRSPDDHRAPRRSQHRQ